MLALLLSIGVTVRTAPATISFAHNAASAGRVVADLGKQLNVTLQANDEMVKEILFVNVQNVAPKDLLDHIARVTSGTWIKNAEAYSLIPNRSERDKVARAAFDARVRTLAKSIQDQLKPAESGDPAKDQKNSDDDPDQAPDARLPA